MDTAPLSSALSTGHFPEGEWGPGCRSPCQLMECWLLWDPDLQTVAAGTLILELGLCLSHRTDTQHQDPSRSFRSKSVSPLPCPTLKPTSQEHLRTTPPRQPPAALEALTVGEVGVLAGLAYMCALGTTQPLRGACSSLMAGTSLMVAGPSSLRPARFPVSARFVLCSLGH